MGWGAAPTDHGDHHEQLLQLTCRRPPPRHRTSPRRHEHQQRHLFVGLGRLGSGGLRRRGRGAGGDETAAGRDTRCRRRDGESWLAGHAGGRDVIYADSPQRGSLRAAALATSPKPAAALTAATRAAHVAATRTAAARSPSTLAAYAVATSAIAAAALAASTAATSVAATAIAAAIAAAALPTTAEPAGTELPAAQRAAAAASNRPAATLVHERPVPAG